jgi:hypothetical protein
LNLFWNILKLYNISNVELIGFILDIKGIFITF